MRSEYYWYFDEAVLNQIEELVGEGYWEDVGNEILNSTSIWTVYPDVLVGSAFDYDSEDEFNDDVLIALRIIDDKYSTLCLQSD